MAVQSVLAPSLGTGRGSFSLRGVVAAAVAMFEARKTRRILAEMEPRLLADIGTSRSDALHEANRPFWDVAAR